MDPISIIIVVVLGFGSLAWRWWEKRKEEKRCHRLVSFPGATEPRG